MRITWEQITALDLEDFFKENEKEFTKCVRVSLLPEFYPNGEQKRKYENFYEVSREIYLTMMDIVKSRKQLPFMLIPAQKGFEQSVNNMVLNVMDNIIPTDPYKGPRWFTDDEGEYQALAYAPQAFEIGEACRYHEIPPSFYPYRNRNEVTTEDLLKDLKDLV